MPRLVVVSNRVALPDESRAGGLAVALRAALSERGGLWFGWSGKRVRAPERKPARQREGGITYCTLDLSREEYDGYYAGFANRTLWPLLHFRLDLVEYSQQTLAAYLAVNARFADALARQLREGDTVWVHDYHLFPLGALLRERGFAGRIGFFLHVPVPSSDMMAALPGHEALFDGLPAYDLVGLQTQRDVERLQDYLRLFGGGKVEPAGRLTGRDGRRFRVAAFPISIDTAGIERQARDAVRRLPVRRLRESLSGHPLMIGVDRLDYSKGLVRRMRAFDEYLSRQPDAGRALTFLQIAPASRSDVAEYQRLRGALEGLAGSINGRHAQPEWTPVRYVNRNFSHDVLTGFYRAAAVGVVTPLRDGMNLVAKEFVASQDPEDPGVLVLSRFAGAASELPQALLVNPYDLEGTAEAIARAAAMPLADRRGRHAAMMETLRAHDITAWRTAFLEALQAG